MERSVKNAYIVFRIWSNNDILFFYTIYDSLDIILVTVWIGIYKIWAAEIFKSLQAHTKTNFGYTGIKNVHADYNKRGLKYDDFMPSFFLSETLKYLYLIFAEEARLSLTEFVYNTEAHPFKVIQD